MKLKSAIDWVKARLCLERAANQVGMDVVAFFAGRVVAHAPVDTGYLVSSVDVIAPKTGNYHVVVQAPYAVPVEFGHFTVSGSWVPPNPFTRRALEDTARAFPGIAAKTKIVAPDGRAPDFGALGGIGNWEVSATAQHFGVTFDRN